MIAPLIALGVAVAGLGATLIILPRIGKLGLRGLGLQGCGSVLAILGLAPLLMGLGIAMENGIVLGIGCVLALLIGLAGAVITWDVWGRWVWERGV